VGKKINWRFGDRRPVPAWYNFDQFKFKSIQIQIQMAGKWPEEVPTKCQMALQEVDRRS
jgi:hypothetical protein